MAVRTVCAGLQAEGGGPSLFSSPPLPCRPHDDTLQACPYPSPARPVSVLHSKAGPLLWLSSEGT